MLYEILNPELSLKFNEEFRFERNVLHPDTQETLYHVGDSLTMKHIFVMLELGIDMVGLTKVTKEIL